MSNKRSQTVRTPHVTIIGSGVGGICMAMQLERAGITTYEIVEKAGDIGGTCRLTFILFHLKAGLTGHAHFRRVMKSSPICRDWHKNMGCMTKPALTPKSSKPATTKHTPNGTLKRHRVMCWKPILWSRLSAS